MPSIVFDTTRVTEDTILLRTRIVSAAVLTAIIVSPVLHAEEWLSLSKTSDEYSPSGRAVHTSMCSPGTGELEA